MKLAFTTRFGHDDEMIFAQQLGADAVIVRFDLTDPTDIDLTPVAHRVRVAGLQLAGVELAGLPQQFDAWQAGLSRALQAARNAGVDTLHCTPPAQYSDPLTEHLGSIGNASSAAGVTVLLDSAHLTPEDLGRLPIGAVHAEFAVVGATTPEEVVASVQSRSTGVLRLEGEGRPLGDAAVDVPRMLAAVAAVGFDGYVRAGTSAPLSEDDDWQPKGSANDLGYLRAVIQSLSTSKR